ncbi:hypothetical protein G5C60_44670 [Streptomyces sp. HC44]|uniref:Secreted protein n=1 Tax=Streptomyces scabichelini TaxID=2711217 RepID=A0A6G4VL48_9ACTN|nr:hypothetical protein [Streptomyces scabichelini]NGO14503.1 hypothetical protein [Streptomyces scabichelini]
MYGVRRIAVVASLAGMLMAAPLGMAAAQGGDGDAGAGGLLSNVAGRNSSGHANLCGAGNLALLKKNTCETYDEHKGGGGDQAGPSGGVLSNVFYARNASGHSNNCGNETVSVLSETSCVAVDRSGH